MKNESGFQARGPLVGQLVHDQVRVTRVTRVPWDVAHRQQPLPRGVSVGSQNSPSSDNPAFHYLTH